MLHTILSRVLIKMGRSYQIDSRVPSSLLLGLVFTKSIALLRGVIFWRRRVFLGRGVKSRHRRGITLGRWVSFGDRCRIDGVSQKGVIIEDGCSFGREVEISCTSHLSRIGQGLRLGRQCGVGAYSFFGASGGITVGDRVVMGQYVTFHAQDHEFEDTSRPIVDQGVTEKGITVGDDCWIGAKATFLDGAVVGNHCVVAAGAVVKGTFPDNCVIGGVPARILRELANNKKAA